MPRTVKFAGTYRYVDTCDVDGCSDAKLTEERGGGI